MSKYQEHADQLEAVANANDQAERVRQEIQNFLHRHVDTIIQCDANRSIICEYFHGDLDDITKATLEDCWANHPGFRRSLACHHSDADARAALIREIQALLAGSDTAKQHTIDSLRYSTIPELAARRDELKRRHDARTKSAAELRAEIQAARSNPEQELPADISREQILHLWEPATFRYWAARIGMAAITKRINEGRN